MNKSTFAITAIAFVSLMAAGCTLSYTEADEELVMCTMIGAQPSVIVEITPDAIANATRVELTACTSHGDCTSREQNEDEIALGSTEWENYYITTAWPYADQSAHVTVEITSGDTVNVAETTVDLEIVSPNGPACEPHVLQGSVVFDGEHWSPRET